MGNKKETIKVEILFVVNSSTNYTSSLCYSESSFRFATFSFMIFKSSVYFSVVRRRRSAFISEKNNFFQQLNNTHTRSYHTSFVTPKNYPLIHPSIHSLHAHLNLRSTCKANNNQRRRKTVSFVMRACQRWTLNLSALHAVERGCIKSVATISIQVA